MAVSTISLAYSPVETVHPVLFRNQGNCRCKGCCCHIDEYLGFHHIISCDVEIPEPRLSDREPCGRVELTEREACSRVCDFEGVENCMTEAEAKQESHRCLRCDHFGYGIFKGGRKEKW